MARVKTFANGGSLLPGDLNAIEDDYEFAFSTYKQIIPSLTLSSSTVVGATLTQNLLASGSSYVLQEGNARNATPLLTGDLLTGLAIFHVDPADFLANTRATKYRLKVALYTNATAPTSTFTFGLYPVATLAGATTVSLNTVGAVTAGSTVGFAAPALNTLSQGNSGDFAAPAAGYFAIGCAITVASMAAGSSIVARAQLQARQV